MEGRRSDAGLECLGVFLDTLQLLTGARDRHRIPVEPPLPADKGAAVAAVAAAPSSANPNAPSLQPDAAGALAPPHSTPAAATASSADAGQAKHSKPLARPEQQQGAEPAEEAAADLQWRVAVRELLPRVLHLCYGPGWATRLGGVAAMELLTDK